MAIWVRLSPFARRARAATHNGGSAAGAPLRSSGPPGRPSCVSRKADTSQITVTAEAANADPSSSPTLRRCPALKRSAAPSGGDADCVGHRGPAPATLFRTGHASQPLASLARGPPWNFLTVSIRSVAEPVISHVVAEVADGAKARPLPPQRRADARLHPPLLLKPLKGSSPIPSDRTGNTTHAARWC